jgi:hypothetical protein
LDEKEKEKDFMNNEIIYCVKFSMDIACNKGFEICTTGCASLARTWDS